MRRHVIDWRPGASPPVLQARAGLLATLREFFARRGVMEVETPLAGVAFGTDPHIEPLRTDFTGPGFASGQSLFLQSSPEFFMKRLLADGSGPIYQVCKAFRNGEAGKLHNPEFSLLEWYRPDFGVAELIAEVAQLVRSVLQQPSLPVSTYAYAELFREYLDVDIFEQDAEGLRAVAVSHSLLGADGLQLDRDGWLDLMMSGLVERKLGREELCFVTDYPASQASLARLNRHDPRTAARFELYYQGVELANGFEELADPDEQAARFEHENCARRGNGQAPMPVDEGLLGALHAGLPACAGVALGLDRLLMCKLGLKDIDQVISFSLGRL